MEARRTCMCAALCLVQLSAAPLRLSSRDWNRSLMNRHIYVWQDWDLRDHGNGVLGDRLLHMGLGGSS